MHALPLLCSGARRSLDARRSFWILGVLPSPPVASRALLAVEFAAKLVLGALILCRLQSSPCFGIFWGRGGSQGGTRRDPEGASQEEGPQGSKGGSLMLQPALVLTLGLSELLLALRLVILYRLLPTLARPRKTAESCRVALRLGGWWLGVAWGVARLGVPLGRFLDKQAKPMGLHLWQAIHALPHVHRHLAAEVPLPHALHTMRLHVPLA